MVNVIKELVEDEGKYFFMKKYYEVKVNPDENLITMTLKDNCEMYTDVTELILQYTKASFSDKLGLITRYKVKNKFGETWEDYSPDHVLYFFNNFNH